MRGYLKQLFDLKHDQDESEVIDSAIRARVRVGGTNLWVLIFAILMASVGLNVNSTAVIIGAMLISPLMGPLIGIGYGAGINDYRLIRSAARSLGIFVAIGLTTSTLYFLLSPLSQAQSELLARTTPTLWDVLIAFFGGCAGIVAQTRKDESTVIPGVAIATALMPPLCTAGFGLATGNRDFFLGAFYLFSINAFFIALATLMFVKLIRLPQHEEANPRSQRNARLIIGACVVAMLVPSSFLAYRLVRDQLFLASAKALVRSVEKMPGAILLAKEISPATRQISLTFGGDQLPPEFKQQMEAQMRSDGFTDVGLTVRQIGSEKVDVVSLKDELQRDVYAHTLQRLDESYKKIESLNLQLAKLSATKPMQEQVIHEIFAQYPGVESVSIADGPQVAKTDAKIHDVLVVYLEVPSALPATDIQRLTAWMQVKFPGQVVRVVQTSASREFTRTVKRR